MNVKIGRRIDNESKELRERHERQTSLLQKQYAARLSDKDSEIKDLWTKLSNQERQLLSLEEKINVYEASNIQDQETVFMNIQKSLESVYSNQHMRQMIQSKIRKFESDRREHVMEICRLKHQIQLLNIDLTYFRTYYK